MNDYWIVCPNCGKELKYLRSATKKEFEQRKVVYINSHRLSCSRYKYDQLKNNPAS